MTNQKTTTNDFQPTMHETVWIKSISKKGVVKALHESEPRTKVTYFSTQKGESKRKTLWFPNTGLYPFDGSRKQKPKTKKSNVEKVIEAQKKFNDELQQSGLITNKVTISEKGLNGNENNDKGSIIISPDGTVTIRGAKVTSHPLKIQVKYFTDITPLEKISKGNWIDLRSAEDVEMKTGEYKLIPLGVGMKLPEGYEANIVPRSSTFKNFGIIQTNHYGVIDDSYSGNDDQWHFPAYAVRDTVIKKNDRICQFRINEIMPEVELETVDNLDEVSRGGFGTSGIK